MEAIKYSEEDFGALALQYLKANPDIVMEVYQKEEDWLRARERFLTASDISVLCGRSTYKGLYRLTHEKMGLLRDANGEETEWQRAGHYLEPAIAQWYQDDEGNPTWDPGPYTIIWNRKYPGIAATLDRITFAAKLGWGVLELKNRGLTTSDDWRAGIIESVRMQVQVQMLVTGFTWGDAAALVGGNQFYVVRVMANKRFQLAAVRRAAQFWRELREGILPTPGEHPDDHDAFNDLHPDDNGDTVQLPASFRDVWEELQDIAAQKKALEKREGALKMAVKAAIGDATIGAGHGYQFSLKSQTPKAKASIDLDDENTERVLSLLDRHGIPYTTNQPKTSRVLRSKEIRA